MLLRVDVLMDCNFDAIVEDKIDLGGRYIKMKVAEILEDGKADNAMLNLLARYFEVHKNSIKIVASENGSSTLVDITH